MESLLVGTSHYENVSSLADYIYSSFSAYTQLLHMYENGNLSATSEPSYVLPDPAGSEDQLFGGQESQKWIFSILACILVGLSGIFPLFIIPTVPDASKAGTSYTLDTSRPVAGIGPKKLKCLLSFAVGSLLGDVFLHLLPEAWTTALATGATSHDALMLLGIWILAGLVSFLICEKLVSYEAELEEETEPDPAQPNANNNLDNAKPEVRLKTESHQKHIAGYLNLVANGFDNFTHGLAVAGSFIISPRIGILTTAAILMHEIPHEIGDFAILLRSGFNPWSAAKAQLSTATIGLAGAIFTLSVDCMSTIGNLTWWILPFTSGCFINIALTSLLPDLLEEKCPKESMKQLLCLLLGIGVMGFVTLTFEC